MNRDRTPRQGRTPSRPTVVAPADAMPSTVGANQYSHREDVMAPKETRTEHLVRSIRLAGVPLPPHVVFVRTRAGRDRKENRKPGVWLWYLRDADTGEDLPIGSQCYAKELSYTRVAALLLGERWHIGFGEPDEETGPLCACGCGRATRRPDLLWLQGHVIPPPPITLAAIPDPVWDGSCCRWQGSVSSSGYGTFRGEYVHRIFWKLFNGPIPPGLVIDHVLDRGCVFRNCIRITHLEAVTGPENSRRGRRQRELRSRTHCPQGHEYTPENTYRAPSTPNSRQCWACLKARARAKTKKWPTTS